MAPAFAPVLVAAVLLLVAGVGKIRRPAPTVGALKSVGVRTSHLAVRVLGTGEILLALVTVTFGGPVFTALIGAGYLAFTGFVVVALHSGGAMSSCGCLGRPDTPPTWTHAVMTAALGLIALVAAGFGGVDVRRLSWTGTDVTLLALTALAAWLAWLAFAVLPHARFPRPEDR